ncbi:MAG: bifunctional riboflavin kinase/FAD synthetase [Paraclostridium sp.]
MTIIKSLDKIKNIGNSVVTIGNFDGIHKGHIQLIKRAVEQSKKNNYKSIVFTFENHPMRYFRSNSIKNLLTNDDKIEILRQLGVDIIVMIPFDEYMTKISAQDFVKKILVDKLKCRKAIVGHDFKFARKKEADAHMLKKIGETYNMEVEVIKPIKIKDVRVSSTYVRALIEDGAVCNVNDFLGRNYSLEGEVIHARKLGRTIGFPTANLSIDDNMLIPRNGIYAVKVYIGDREFYGATNIGYNPTVNGQSLSIETNILDFNEDIYGEVIRIEFLERIRDEKKFKSLEDLKSQLSKDVNFVYKKYVYKSISCMVK